MRQMPEKPTVCGQGTRMRMHSAPSAAYEIAADADVPATAGSRRGCFKKCLESVVQHVHEQSRIPTGSKHVPTAVILRETKVNTIWNAF